MSDTYTLQQSIGNGKIHLSGWVRQDFYVEDIQIEKWYLLAAGNQIIAEIKRHSSEYRYRWSLRVAFLNKGLPNMLFDYSESSNLILAQKEVELTLRQYPEVFVL
jgi:hypothetical protein